VNARYRDVRYALPFALQMWLFLSPVVFPASLIGGTSRAAFSLNPLVGLLDGARWSLLDGPEPPLSDLLGLLSLVVVFVAAVAYFGRTEREMADLI
jgi:lipopolysaccharide transport system permease protein